MKKSAIKKVIMGLGLITSVIFTSCIKKSENPKPNNNPTIITTNNISTNDSLYTYLNQGDLSIINTLNNKIWFLTKINDDTLKTVDSLYQTSDFVNYRLNALDYTDLFFKYAYKKMVYKDRPVGFADINKVSTITIPNTTSISINIMKNKNKLYMSNGNDYDNFKSNIISYIEIINNDNFKLYINNYDGTWEIRYYTSKKIIRYKLF